MYPTTLSGDGKKDAERNCDCSQGVANMLHQFVTEPTLTHTHTHTHTHTPNHTNLHSRTPHHISGNDGQTVRKIHCLKNRKFVADVCRDSACCSFHTHYQKHTDQKIINAVQIHNVRLGTLVSLVPSHACRKLQINKPPKSCYITCYITNSHGIPCPPRASLSLSVSISAP